MRTALGTSVTQAEVIQTAYNSSQQELEDLRVAALEACQSVEEGDVHAGSSMASYLCALGGHVTQCVQNALCLGVQKTLSVVQSHYLVNLGALLLTVYFGTPSMFTTLWFGFDYGTNPPLGILII
jgi:hypothetical protein